MLQTLDSQMMLYSLIVKLLYLKSKFGFINLINLTLMLWKLVARSKKYNLKSLINFQIQILIHEINTRLYNQNKMK